MPIRYGHVPIGELTLGDLDELLYRQFSFWNEPGVDSKRAVKPASAAAAQDWVKVPGPDREQASGAASSSSNEDDDEEDPSDGQRR